MASMRFLGDLGGGYAIQVDIQKSGLCRMIARGPGQVQIGFTNVYRSINGAFSDAERLAVVAFRHWNVPPPQQH